MGRNEELHFRAIPRMNIQRSKLRRPYDHKLTFDTGKLIPFYIDEILPGDTVKMKTSILARMMTPIQPTMDNIFMDTYFFFCPNRILYVHWKELMGENPNGAWLDNVVQYQVPHVEAPAGGWGIGTIADYFGIPTGVDNITVSSLPFRAYAKVFNEWFRSESIIEPQLDDFSNDSDITGSSTMTYSQDNAIKGDLPLNVGRYQDYFSGALPAPQKGAEIGVPIGGGTQPVIGIEGVTETWSTPETTMEGQPIAIGRNSSTSWETAPFPYDLDTKLFTGTLSNDKNIGLGVDLSSLTTISINTLRQAYAVQKLLELDARGGTRYTEILRAEFNIITSDARLQRPEYLGGKRIPINMSAVYQTSATDAVSPQGNSGAYSLTVDNDELFTKSFEEHGILIGVLCCRTDRTYQQGIQRWLSRRDRYDYYTPTFANLGEMGIKVKELYAQGTSDDEEIFGYQEAWAEYRFKNSEVSGELRSTAPQPLDSWHYADYYTSRPYLDKDWFDETKNNVKRTLAIQNHHQFIADIYCDTVWTRPMPIYSVPGLTANL